ncbi:hypothetical protein [Candidatus Velamenicoccus archaeovorus]|uniref:hypothetical protein n=1 Tax=Velamenicoccus archaeovorus TaxID=1930593 RepID=UPI000FFE86CC|nr:hypothetical protein [Candidatus Velamenicoccus archaeovorus]
MYCSCGQKQDREAAVPLDSSVGYLDKYGILWQATRVIQRQQRRLASKGKTFFWIPPMRQKKFFCLAISFLALMALLQPGLLMPQGILDGTEKETNRSVLKTTDAEGKAPLPVFLDGLSAEVQADPVSAIVPFPCKNCNKGPFYCAFLPQSFCIHAPPIFSS